MNDFEQELREYENILFKSEAGKIARDYLKNRGIVKKTAKFWNLGYCPIGFIPDCHRDQVDNEVYPFWEKMWGRLIIPIIDQNGKVISLSGRQIEKYKDSPKYDHYRFPARQILFGLNQNKNNIMNKNRCIITEGQMDVISSWQNGLDIVVSSFGAHGSLSHLALISRYCDHIDILYDGDQAGKKGMQDIRKITSIGELNINIVNNIFSYGEDLDSWIQKNSPKKLFNLMDNRKDDILKYKLHMMKKV